jgi:hypothetical protein
MADTLTREKKRAPYRDGYVNMWHEWDGMTEVVAAEQAVEAQARG